MSAWTAQLISMCLLFFAILKKKQQKNRNLPLFRAMPRHFFICHLEVNRLPPQRVCALVALIWECWGGKGTAGSGCPPEQCVISKDRTSKLLVHGAAEDRWSQEAGKFSQLGRAWVPCYSSVSTTPLLLRRSLRNVFWKIDGVDYLLEEAQIFMSQVTRDRPCWSQTFKIIHSRDIS